MAAGDVANYFTATVTGGSYIDFQPGAGVEIVIHNFSYAQPMELYYRDTNAAAEVKVDEDASAGSRMGVFLHCTNTRFYRVKNTGAASGTFAADGITTK